MENGQVIPIFIFDRDILSGLEDEDDARVTFIYDEVMRLKSELERFGSSLMIKHGEPVAIFREITGEYPITKVYTNHDYEPYARKRDEAVRYFLQSKDIELKTFKDQVIFEKDDILKANGEPYTVYTPYMKRWRSAFGEQPLAVFDTGPLLQNLVSIGPLSALSMDELGFKRSPLVLPERETDTSIISSYSQNRDIPSLNGTSRLGMHLRFGTIGIRHLVKEILPLSEVFLNELIWREFYMMILWHFPHVAGSSFKKQYDLILWRNDEGEFQAWCEGRTGYPIVDAGMRQLNATGFMHNRLRMITASFLTKLLLIDWRWGEAYFARKLLDYELASNNGGWQWSAGTGCDAAPYFRIFNPESQTKKYDPDMNYIKTWVPELGTEQYPEMVVNYRAARERALSVYRETLK
jgi:deoxyribodipyrimidine photo-lyase